MDVMKYPPAIQDAWVPAWSDEETIDRDAAREVWSMSATKSMLAQAKKTWDNISESDWDAVLISRDSRLRSWKPGVIVLTGLRMLARLPLHLCAPLGLEGFSQFHFW